MHKQAQQASRQNRFEFMYVVVSAHGLCVPLGMGTLDMVNDDVIDGILHTNTDNLNQSINLNPNAKWDEVYFKFYEEEKSTTTKN